jgi:hypothetical protein
MLRMLGRRVRDRAVPVFVDARQALVGRAIVGRAIAVSVPSDGLSDDDAVALLRRVVTAQADGRTA